MFAYMQKKQYLCGMKQKIVQILIWLGIVFGCAFVIVTAGKMLLPAAQTVSSLKWFQFFSVAGMFLLPPMLCGYLWDTEKKPFRWLQMDRGAHWSYFLMAAGLMVVALPAVNLLADLNHMIPLPDSLLAEEEQAEAMTKTLLQADSIGAMLCNFGLMALLPALAEEMTFRGTLQQIIQGVRSQDSGFRIHLAIWITAIVFSAIHMQFLGFIPRMLMGAMFGYLFVWTGTLWIPIVMHFTNNAVTILLFYVLPENSNADTFGAGTTWWVGVLSLMITCLGLLIFYRRTRTQ